MSNKSNKRVNNKSRLNSLVDRKIERAFTRNTEQKYWTQVQSNAPASSSGTVSDLILVPQGDTDTSRDGDRIHAKSLKIRGSVAYGGAVSILRFIIFQWFGADVPTPALVLITTATADVINSPKNADSFPANGSGRGRILWDHRMQVDSGGISQRTFEAELKGFKPDLQFIAGGTSGSNHVYILTVSDLAATNPSYNFYSEMLFTDS